MKLPVCVPVCTGSHTCMVFTDGNDTNLHLRPAGDLILEVANRAPVKDEFQFTSIQEGLEVQGTYVLQYEVQPHLPGLPALTSCTTVVVAAGHQISLELQVQSYAQLHTGTGAAVCMLSLLQNCLHLCAELPTKSATCIQCQASDTIVCICVYACMSPICFANLHCLVL